MNKESFRTCLSCRKRFHSTSPSNRFCKNCKKKRRQLYGGLEAIAMPSHIKLAEMDQTVSEGPYIRRRHSRPAR